MFDQTKWIVNFKLLLGKPIAVVKITQFFVVFLTGFPLTSKTDFISGSNPASNSSCVMPQISA